MLLNILKCAGTSPTAKHYLFQKVHSNEAEHNALSICFPEVERARGQAVVLHNRISN